MDSCDSTGRSRYFNGINDSTVIGAAMIYAR